MKALQLQVDPWDIDFDQTRKQDLELEKAPKKKKRGPVTDDNPDPADPDTDEEKDEDDLDEEKLDDDELEDEEEEQYG